MKDRVVAVVLFALTLLFFAIAFPHHRDGKWEMEQHVVVAHLWAFNNISLPRIGRSHKDEPFSHPSDEISYKLPPSEMQVLSMIGSMHEMRDFSLDGWSITFAVVSLESGPDETKGVYRAIAGRPGRTRYAYRISQAQTRSPAVFLIVVEPPLPIGTCANGTEPIDDHCNDGSNPK
jgi:hypothetical protein